MIHQELVTYICTQLKKGVKKDHIVMVLHAKGWNEKDIHLALAHANLQDKTSGKKVTVKKAAFRTAKIILIFFLIFIVVAGTYIFIRMEKSREASVNISLPAMVQ